MKNQTMIYDGYRYSVESLVGATLKHEVKTAKIETLGLYSNAPNDNTFLSFVAHVKQMQKADLKYPIILAENGTVLDGYHRIVNALVNGKDEIEYVRLLDEDLPPYMEKLKDEA